MIGSSSVDPNGGFPPVSAPDFLPLPQLRSLQ